jgi:hypothetical protein
MQRNAEERRDPNFTNYHENKTLKTIMKKFITHVTHVTVVTHVTLAALIASLATGCTVLSYTTPTGERFTRGSLGANTSISSLAIEAGTNGVRRVELRGYQQDSSQALSAVTEAAVKAAIESAK